MSDKACPPTTDPGEIFCTLPRSDGELRVALGKYKGNSLPSIRVWYRATTGELRPCQRRGISLRISELEDVIEGLRRLSDAYHRKHDEVTPSDGA